MGDTYDHLFKILLVGDSGVGKSCLLMRFTADRFDDVTTSTIGVDFRVKYVTLAGRRVKLTVWDTAGQERFRTLTSSYYRGAQGIVFAYDVTRRETFENVERIWMREVELYSNVEDAVKMVVANKVDLVGGPEGEGAAAGGDGEAGAAAGTAGAAAAGGSLAAREVSSEEGHALARANGCLFVETSAKANIAVTQAFEELVLKILETPGLADAAGALVGGSPGGGGVRVGGAGPASASTGACSC